VHLLELSTSYVKTSRSAATEWKNISYESLDHVLKSAVQWRPNNWRQTSAAQQTKNTAVLLCVSVELPVKSHVHATTDITLAISYHNIAV